MPRMQLDFLRRDEENPTDQELLMQLAYGLCGSLRNPREERSGFVTAYDLPHSLVRRAVKLLVKQCGLPIPESRVDEWIEWHRGGGTWTTPQVNSPIDGMSAKADELMKLDS